MPVTYYPAIIERGEHGFGVFFPDVPGCTSAGESIQDAARNAEEALRGHLAAMANDGDEIPAPSDLDKVEHDPDVKEAARVLVRAELPGKAVRLNISMDEGLVEAMDSHAEMRGMARSAYLAELVRADLTTSQRVFYGGEGWRPIGRIFSDDKLDEVRDRCLTIIHHTVTDADHAAQADSFINWTFEHNRPLFSKIANGIVQDDSPVRAYMGRAALQAAAERGFGTLPLRTMQVAEEKGKRR